MKISEILKEHGAIGRANGMKRKQLQNIVALPVRGIVAAVFRERREGVLILSDTVHGYYLPASVDEVGAFVKTQEKRIISHSLSVHAARQYLKEHKAGQRADDE